MSDPENSDYHGNMTTDDAPLLNIFPRVGAKAIAVIGPDYAPNQKVEVEIVSKASLDSWVCLDTRDGRMLTVRTRKLSKV